VVNATGKLRRDQGKPQADRVVEGLTRSVMLMLEASKVLRARVFGHPPLTCGPGRDG
jgi:hypothetical protein